MAKKLQPKIVIAENVMGIVKGKARGYVKEIVQAYKEAGYTTQLFRLNAAQMGVPQARQRVFFVSRRDDLDLGPIRLKFNEKPITFGDVSKQLHIDESAAPSLTNHAESLWSKIKQGQQFSKAHPNGSMWNHVRIAMNLPCPTLAAAEDKYHPTIPRRLVTKEWMACSSFPQDYVFENKKPQWFMGMSVPPFMVQRIALEVRKQWLS